MSLQIVRNDITRMQVDAIVNAANESLLGGGGVDGCIHRAAGPALLEECRRLGGCRTGSARITGAGNLPCRYVIHAVGPRWRGGGYGERELLVSCYRTALCLAAERGCESVAFPLISAGIYGYPKEEALRVAVETCGSFLLENDMLIYLVIFDKGAFRIGERLFADIAAYIDDHYVEEYRDSEAVYMARLAQMEGKGPGPKARPSGSLPSAAEPPLSPPAAPSGSVPSAAAQRSGSSAAPLPPPRSILPQLFGARPAAPPSMSRQDAHHAAPASLEDAVRQIDESFAEMLFRKIDEKGMTDVQCYKKANIDRKLFSKIRNDKRYRPSKSTVLAFAIALELSLEETGEMLMKAGFALSRSNKFDIIVEFFIRRGNYNIFEINEALFAFDQSLLGV